MHDTALASGAAFFRVYGDQLENPNILDVGSMDVNGTLKPLIPFGSHYTGADIAEGMNVDVVLQDRDHLPFRTGTFDLVVSTSCLEHDRQFWVTFCEMVRVTKVDGYVYVSVPAEGPYHAHPVDCWRFLGDAAGALAEWSNRLIGPIITVAESFMVHPRRDVWTDNVMIFRMPKAPKRDLASVELTAQGFRVSYNAS